MTPLVAPLPPDGGVEAYGRYDAELRTRAAAAEASGQRLVYLAHFDGRTASTGIQALIAGDPLARVGPRENIVELRTERYDEDPLRIAGPGAGDELTAANLLGDVWRAARKLARRRRGSNGSSRPRLARSAAAGTCF